MDAGTLKLTNVPTSLTNLGLGTANTANFGAINAADPSLFYPAPVARLSHNSTTGPFLSTPQALTVAGNFAYVGSSTSTSLQILDLTNPLLPLKRGSLIGTGGATPNLSYPRGIAISGSYAYVTSSTNNSLQVINIANPDAPVATAALLNGAGGALLSAPYGIAVSGNFAYIASSTSNALEIVNITNPAAPVHAGQLTNTTWLNRARAVAVSGSYAYVVTNTGNCLAVVNVSNPAAPSLAATLAHNAAGPLLAGPTAIAIAGNYAYVTSATSNALQIIDITNPLVPVAKGALVTGTAGAQLSSPSAVTVVGTTAFVTASGTTKAVQLVDVSNPLAPKPKGQLLDGSAGAALNGPTGIAVSGGYAFVTASLSSALQVLRIGSGGGYQIQNTTVLTKDANNNLLLGSGLPTGKVAIGTTNATSRLTVAGTDATAANSVVNFTDSTNKSLLLVQNDGKVGIGTSAPQGKLDIFNSTNAATTPLLSIRSDFAAAGRYGMIRFGDQTQSVNYQKGAIIYESVADSARGKLHLALENTDGPGSVALSDAKLTVLSNGNTGIGTTTPTAKLEVAGDLKVSGAITSTGAISAASVTLPDGSSLTSAKPTTLYNSAGTAVANVGADGKVNFANGLSIGTNPDAVLTSNSTAYLGQTLANLGYRENASAPTHVSSVGYTGDVTFSSIAYSGGVTYITGAFPRTPSSTAVVAKILPSNDAVWVKTITGATFKSLVIDAAGNVVVVGEVSGTTSELGAYNVTGNNAGLIVKYSADGAVLWAKAIGSTASVDLRSVAVDLAGNVVVVGFFVGNIATLGGTANLINTGGSDGLLAKFSSDGSLQWAQAVGGTSSDELSGVAVDATGQIYVAGRFSAMITSLGAANVTSGGETDGLVAKFAAGGSVLWTRAIGGAAYDYLSAVAVNAGSDQIVVAGSFSGTLSTLSDAANVTAAGSTDGLVVAFDAAGSAQWARAVGGTAADSLASVTFDGTGSIIAAGSFSGVMPKGSGRALLVGAVNKPPKPTKHGLTPFPPSPLILPRRCSSACGIAALKVASSACAGTRITPTLLIMCPWSTRPSRLIWPTIMVVNVWLGSRVTS